MKRWYRTAQLLLVTVAASGCGVAQQVAGALAEVQTVQRDVAKATGHDNIRVNLQNNSYLSVGVVNSRYGELPDQERRARAREIAAVAYRSLPSRDSLRRVNVAFVIHKSYLLVFNYDDARDSFAFTPEELREVKGEGRSSEKPGATGQGNQADEAR